MWIVYYLLASKSTVIVKFYTTLRCILFDISIIKHFKIWSLSAEQNLKNESSLLFYSNAHKYNLNR